MHNIELIKQPTGNSCGPTCLKMLYDSIGGPKDIVEYTIEMISEWCGTDWIVGTPPDRMEKGMKRLNLGYVEYTHSLRPYDLLQDVIKSGNVGLLRTITKGVPHWIIVNNFSGTLYNVLDPWLGEIQYYKPELEKIWSLRQYQFFEIKIPTNEKFFFYID